MAPTLYFPVGSTVTNESSPQQPGAKIMRAESGITKTRATGKRGLSWTRTYDGLNVHDEDDQILLSFLRRAWNRGYRFKIQHQMMHGSGLDPKGSYVTHTSNPDTQNTLFAYTPELGVGDGTFSRSSTATYDSLPYVDGSNQSGDTITTRGWPASRQKLLVYGDYIRIDGYGTVREVQNFVSSDSNGVADIKVSPPLHADEATSGGEHIYADDIYIWAQLASAPNIPDGYENAFYINGLTLDLIEVPNA